VFVLTGLYGQPQGVTVCIIRVIRSTTGATVCIIGAIRSATGIPVCIIRVISLKVR
jgi:hypothetical protein